MEPSPSDQQQHGPPQERWRTESDEQLDGKAYNRLRQPVVVPQITSGRGKPFARAYSDVLSERGLSLDEFMEFIDNLNVDSTANPPLQILNLAGGIVSMVPNHITMIVGNAVSLGAMAGTATVTKTRTALFLKKANSELFAPRGLKVEIVKSQELKSRIGLHPGAQLVVPLAESHGLSVEQRRIRALHSYIAPLTFDVPPPNVRTNVLDRMSAWQVKRQVAKFEKDALKARKEALEKAQEGSLDRTSSAEEYNYKEMKRRDKKIKERDKKIKERDKEMKKKDKEMEQADKIYWLIVEDL